MSSIHILRLLFILKISLVSPERRVNWFFPKGGVTQSNDGLNLTAWATKYRGALTGVFPCCSCWEALDDGTFVSTGRCQGWTSTPQEMRELKDLNLSIIPTGHVDVDWLLKKRWNLPGAMESLVTLAETEGWDGIGIDNENDPADEDWDPLIPDMYASLLEAMSSCLNENGKHLSVDVTSTWRHNIGGPEYIPGYGLRAPSGRFMDMAEYFYHPQNPGNNMKILLDLQEMLTPSQVGIGVGLVEMPGHENASCSGWPQCTDFDNPACMCLDYGWDKDAFRNFIMEAANAGVEEIDVWRNDITPPPGTVAFIPPWWIETLTDFLSGSLIG